MHSAKASHHLSLPTDADISAAAGNCTRHGQGLAQSAVRSQDSAETHKDDATASLFYRHLMPPLTHSSASPFWACWPCPAPRPPRQAQRGTPQRLGPARCAPPTHPCTRDSPSSRRTISPTALCAQGLQPLEHGAAQGVLGHVVRPGAHLAPPLSGHDWPWPGSACRGPWSPGSARDLLRLQRLRPS